jgi:COP9 signalosome complex subunit 2
MPIPSLLQAFENDNINQFEGILNRDKASILNGDFVKEYMPSIQLHLHSRVLVRLAKPYKRVKL